MSRLAPSLIAATGLLFAGCEAANKITPDQKVQATHEWNAARANVLTNLAQDQYKEGNFDKCQDTLAQSLRLDGDNPNLHVLAAKLAIEQGKLEIAESQLTEARRLAPQSAEVDYLWGVVLQRWHQPDKACDAYASAVTKNPAELSYVLAYAEMLITIGKPADALTLLHTKAQTFEHSGVLHDEIGQILASQGRYGEAIGSFRTATMLSTDDATIREHLGFALLSAKRYPEASDVFERLGREPGYEKRADVHAALAECQVEGRRPTDAQANYQAATELNPTCAGYWLGLARVKVQLDDLPGAELAARKGASLDPTSSGAQCMLGYIRLKQKQLPQAMTAFRAASELDPRDSVSVTMQGYVLAQQGQPSEAEKYYQRALEIDPHDTLASRLAAR